MTFSLFVTIVQQLGVIGKFSLEILEPMQSMSKLLQILAFDIAILNLHCWQSVS